MKQGDHMFLCGSFALAALALAAHKQYASHRATKAFKSLSLIFKLIHSQNYYPMRARLLI